LIEVEGLRDRIQEAYVAGGYNLGWKLLYSPSDVLNGPRLAFVGLNPGGSVCPENDAELATVDGSAYVTEVWERASQPGQSKLQRQVRCLFDRLGEAPESVLAGNLVPFRSPSWEKLPMRDWALEFGKSLWRDILAETRPELVIAMGDVVFSVLREILGVEMTQRILVSWGSVSGEHGKFAHGTLVRLPRLSRFGIITRPTSQDALRALIPGYAL
jgi:hypothetical protein